MQGLDWKRMYIRFDAGIAVIKERPPFEKLSSPLKQHGSVLVLGLFYRCMDSHYKDQTAPAMYV